MTDAVSDSTSLPAFDITLPKSVEQDAALAVDVLRRFKEGPGAFTPGDAGRVIKAIEQLHARAFPAGLSMVVTSKAELPWRCYFCDEAFEDKRAAALHFGADEDCTPACQIKGSEGGLLKALRDTEEELFKATCRLHDESGEVLRTWAAVGSNHHAALRSAEETGYERGLNDQPFRDPTEDEIEAAARAAWADVMNIPQVREDWQNDEMWREEHTDRMANWPDDAGTHLGAEGFRSAARIALIAARNVGAAR